MREENFFSSGLKFKNELEMEVGGLELLLFFYSSIQL